MSTSGFQLLPKCWICKGWLYCVCFLLCIFNQCSSRETVGFSFLFFCSMILAFHVWFENSENQHFRCVWRLVQIKYLFCCARGDNNHPRGIRPPGEDLMQPEKQPTRQEQRTTEKSNQHNIERGSATCLRPRGKGERDFIDSTINTN